MNSGKTHSFFTWAAAFASVPSLPLGRHTEAKTILPSLFDHTGIATRAAFRSAPHDPLQLGKNSLSQNATVDLTWTKPDFVLKV